MHASHGSSLEDEEYFKNISLAYEILSDVHLRKIYDREGLEAVERVQNKQKWDIPPLFSAEHARVPWIPQGKPKAPDTTHNISITLEQFYFGVEKKFMVNRQLDCPKCQGSGFVKSQLVPNNAETCNGCNGAKSIVDRKILHVKVEPGTKSGAKFVFASAGSQDLGTEPGDVIIIVNHKDHPQYRYALVMPVKCKVLYLFCLQRYLLIVFFWLC